MLQTSIHSSSDIYQIGSLESVYHLHCIVIKDLIEVLPEWPSGFLYFLQFEPTFVIRRS